MGKTFRRGGAERGYSSPGKSLRDKRQRGVNRSEFREDTSDKYKSKIPNKTKHQGEDYYGKP